MGNQPKATNDMNTRKTKHLAALRLNHQGVPTAKIAAKLGVSIRTIQRWLLAEASLPSEDDQTPGLENLEGFKPESGYDFSTPSSSDCERFDEDVARLTALRLLKLSAKAITAIEDTLDNPYVKQSDKLKAAQLVGDWLGLGATPQNFLSITERVEQTFSIVIEEDSEDSGDDEDVEDDEEPEGTTTTTVTTKVIDLPPTPEILAWMTQEEAKHRDANDQLRLARSLRSRLDKPPQTSDDE